VPQRLQLVEARRQARHQRPARRRLAHDPPRHGQVPTAQPGHGGIHPGLVARHRPGRHLQQLVGDARQRGHHGHQAPAGRGAHDGDGLAHRGGVGQRGPAEFVDLRAERGARGAGTGRWRHARR
jgi:hypothetical protein